MIRSPEFQALRDVVSGALRATTAREHTRVTARLRIAWLAASQLRTADELYESERNGPDAGKARVQVYEGKVAPLRILGDRVLDTPIEDVMESLDPLRKANTERGLEAAGRLERQLRGEDEQRRELSAAYGYDDAMFLAERPLRVHVRLAINLAADATFAPYAFGTKESARYQQATLRVDLRSLNRAIWAWASTNRALARALYAARRPSPGPISPFPAFTAAYERALTYQLDNGTLDVDTEQKINRAAGDLARIATEGMSRTAEVGRTGDANITQQVARYLVERHPDWVPDELAKDAEEEFAIGAADLLSEALGGVRSVEETAEILDGIVSELRRIQAERAHSVRP